MDFRPTADQDELRRAARRFLAEHAGPAQVRAAMAGPDGCDHALWRRLGAELGWTGLIIPEELGGAGLTWVELVLVLEEAGRALLCAPLWSSACLAASALAAASPEQQGRWLPGLAAGETVAALAVAEEAGRWDPTGVAALAEPGPGGYTLRGRKAYVVGGHLADLLVVAARAPGSVGAAGLSLFVVPASAPGLRRRALPTLDQTRRLAELELDGVRVAVADRIGDEGAGWAALAPALDLGCIGLAAEQVGGAERCLELTVEYARTRQQFGRPIGAFQAVKHRCADLLLQVESARSAAWYAGWAAAAGDPELGLAAPLAKAYCSDAFFACAAECIQLHGGIGFTWEHDAHLYFKRAAAGAALLGDAAYHRARLADRVGI